MSSGRRSSDIFSYLVEFSKEKERVGETEKRRKRVREREKGYGRICRLMILDRYSPLDVSKICIRLLKTQNRSFCNRRFLGGRAHRKWSSTTVRSWNEGALSRRRNEIYRIGLTVRYYCLVIVQSSNRGRKRRGRR